MYECVCRSVCGWTLTMPPSGLLPPHILVHVSVELYVVPFRFVIESDADNSTARQRRHKSSHNHACMHTLHSRDDTLMTTPKRTYSHERTPTHAHASSTQLHTALPPLCCRLETDNDVQGR